MLLVICLFLVFTRSQSQLQSIYVAPNASSCPFPRASCYSDIGKALGAISTPSTEVLIVQGNYNLTDSIQITSLSGITIRKYSTSALDMVNVTCEGENAGVTFLNCDHVTVTGLSFSNCGVLHNSTSIDSSNGAISFIEFYAALYFSSCSNLTLMNNTFSQSKGVAVQLYAVSQHNYIIRNFFIANPYRLNVTKGGGLYIEFPYCFPGSITSCGSVNVANAFYLIKNNSFVKNVAWLDFENNSDIFILPHETDHVAFGRGGGLSLYFKGSSNHNTFFISHNRFIGNKAIFGAGMFLEFQDTSSNNNITVSDCQFMDNIAAVSGGGFHFSSFSFNNNQPLYNRLEVVGSHFVGNSAFRGGGMSIEVSRERKFGESTNAIIFTDSCWKKNSAGIGAGLEISVSGSQVENTGALVNIFLDGCRFIENFMKPHIGYGALYVNGAPVTFENYVEFQGNKNGSALVVTGSMIVFASDIEAVFSNNTGRNGAAITLLALSYMIVHENTSFHFRYNEASDKGGAIYEYNTAGRNDLSSRACFMKYFNISVSQKNWKANFTFFLNKAKVGNSIFSTSIRPCVWGRGFGLEDETAIAVNETFCNHIFQYNYNNSCDDQIKTDPYKLNLQSVIHVNPGITQKLNLSAMDDRLTSANSYLVLTAHSSEGSEAILDQRYNYISEDSILFHRSNKISNANESKVILESSSPRHIQVEIIVEFFAHCRPGQIVVESTRDCGCPVTGSYYGYIVCHKQEASILLGYWIGKTNKTDKQLEISVGRCMFCVDSFVIKGEQYRGSHILLESDYGKVQKTLCGETRTGIICSKCINSSYAPAINDINFKCVHCEDKVKYYSWFVFLLLRIFFPFGIFFIVYCSKFCFMTGLLNGPVLFAQMITTVVPLDASGKIAIENRHHIYRAIYGIWNLDFCVSCFNTPCLHSSFSDVDLLLLDYSIAFLPLLFVVFTSLIYWIDLFEVRWYVWLSSLCSQKLPRAAKFARFLLNPERLVNGLIGSIMLSYSKIAVMTGFLLSPIPLYNSSDDGSVVNHHLVLGFNGTISFFGEEHRKFALPVIFFSGFFLLIVPIALIVQRFNHREFGGFFNSLLQEFQKEFKTDEDSISLKEKSWSFDLPTINCGCHKYSGDKYEVTVKYSCRPVYFRVCIKFFHGFVRILTSWGQEEYRWVPGLYLVFRLMFVLIYAVADDFMIQYLGQMILCVLIAQFFFTFSPYKKRLHNIVDGSTFLLLAVIISISLYQYYRSIVNLKLLQGAFYVQHILLFLPCVWMMACVIKVMKDKEVFQYLKKCLCCCKSSDENEPLIN